jgi:hypothetical protein
MSLWSKIRGTVETLFQIGLQGPQLKNNSGAIESRNATDTGFAIARGATPVGANDLATKAYTDAGDVGASGAVQEIRIAVALVTVSSVTSLPIGSIIVDAQLDITTPYSGGATISLGQTGAVAEFQATTDNLPQATGLYQNMQDTAAASTNPLLVTVVGAPAAGDAQAIVRYVVTPQG